MRNRLVAGASDWKAICKMAVRLLGVTKWEQERLRSDLLYSCNVTIVGHPARLGVDISMVGPRVSGNFHIVTVGGETVKGFFCDDLYDATWYGNPYGEVVKLIVQRGLGDISTIWYQLEYTGPEQGEEGVFLATWLEAVNIELLASKDLNESVIRKFAANRKFVTSETATRLLQALELAPA